MPVSSSLIKQRKKNDSGSLTVKNGADILTRRRQPTNNLRRVTSRKNEGLNYATAED
jgi:hypothetical protein